MIKFYKFTLLIFLILNTQAIGKEDFFNEAKILFDNGKIEESKFLFQRNIVFNPKDAKSYIYLAKIFKEQNNDKEKEKNINTALLLEPTNEDAMFMLINNELDKSNYSAVKDLKENFQKICKNLCDKIKFIDNSLKDIEPKNES